DAYCFSPARSESQRNAERRAARVTPMTPSKARRRLHPNRKRPHRDRYDTTTYRRAVHRACARANRKAVEAALRENPGLPPDAVLVPKWSPNQLRHNRATELRPYGLDVTKTVLGHSKVETSLIYAEKDLKAAMELVAKIG